MIKIDSHIHLWKYDSYTDDSWMINEYEFLRQDFTSSKLLKSLELATLGVDGAMLIQHKSNDIVNQEYMNFASNCPKIKGIIGWVNFKDDLQLVDSKLELYAKEPLFKGFRHMVEFETMPKFLLADDFCHGISLLAKYNFTYDLLVNYTQLDDAIEFVSYFPHHKIVLNHIAKPDIKNWGEETQEFKQWADKIVRLAQISDNIYCKFSGYKVLDDFTAANNERIIPYFKHIMETFGAKRVMFGSDWPVSLASCDYGEAWQSIIDLLQGYSKTYQEMVLGATACKFYNI
jgi:L-fuconolactonase